MVKPHLQKPEDNNEIIFVAPVAFHTAVEIKVKPPALLEHRLFIIQMYVDIPENQVVELDRWLLYLCCVSEAFVK